MTIGATATVDLGVIIDGKLRFDKHIANIVSKAHSRAALIRRLLFRAFTVFVRPLPEYCSPVWNPHYHCDIEKIESVQRRFTKYIGGFKHLSYRERLLRLNAETLELRRLKSDLTLKYRTVYGHCGLTFASFFTLSDNITRGHCFKIQKQYSRVNCRAFSFANRCIDLGIALIMTFYTHRLFRLLKDD